ncbi:MAG: TraR/DksA C4-type zinc finger protein [Thiovulaceae bacterium]|nr:TraR/DksA C4-type zinc finger protein [Sulfurimonadaceae bacterium]
MQTIDLNEFKLQLQTMKDGLLASIERLDEEMEAIVTDDTNNDMEDLASLESESMHHTALLKQQRHELDEVNLALEKIKKGIYGICEESGDKISVERLRAEPYARNCRKHAQQIQQVQK